ncbi:aminoglycoside phosphotransferase family protein [Catenuloplanes atrovinosus]|uniref:Aminoglycoside phosphotransferase (APT) family kinase protein n=1 Tax=Catenuloplanes atrovinosus TaxID=137266 RepID=A0AAE3YGP2_9ACTN|nr:aminoglycoside phosphotransferase family protein [Catenuloplanes atrovinosus]MDR7273349.1 aminoglycoside phosphotransferase (APT) family kinase protein [Catenuloplanes atrovinosus]
MTLHDDEIPVDETIVRALLRAERPEWAGLPLARAGAGTDNTMFRLGDELLVRVPRRPFTAGMLSKERHWLPRFAPLLPLAVPEPVHDGRPSAVFPLPWSVYRWIDGAEAGPDTVRDWPAFGRDLAAFVRELHGLDPMDASRAGDLCLYRGGALRDAGDWTGRSFAECAGLVPGIDALERMWREAVALPDPAAPHVWLHSDLKPTNLLVRDGALHAVIDFAGLTRGFPDAEHATIWDFPAPAREAYWAALDLDDATWRRARAWAIVVATGGIAYYRDTFPAFVAECRARLTSVLAFDR